MASPAPARLLPRTRTCFVCGADNAAGFRLRLRVEGDLVVADYSPPPEANGYRGIVHGGIAMTLMDEVMTWAAILATRRVCVAAEMSTRFRLPMPVGATYRIEGRVTRAASRLVLAEARVRGPDGGVAVSATGKYMPAPQTAAADASIDFLDPVPDGLI